MSTVDHPRHYNAHASGVECIAIVRHLPFNLGNAVKYLWRAGEKGPLSEDYRKAAWYLRDEADRAEEDGDLVFSLPQEVEVVVDHEPTGSYLRALLVLLEEMSLSFTGHVRFAPALRAVADDIERGAS